VRAYPCAHQKQQVRDVAEIQKIITPLLLPIVPEVTEGVTNDLS
jgi:hypothetical protein